MEQNGIAQAVISDLGDGWLAFPDKETLMAANSRLRKAVSESGGRLHFLVYINPQLTDWRTVFDEFIQDACGVKLWISLKTPGNGLENTKDVLRAAASSGKPVLIHTFDRTDNVPDGQIGMSEIIELAHAVPDCRIVAAHAGGNWRKTISRAADVPENVYFDISGGYPERTMTSRLVSAFGAERVLYGSDAYGRSFASQLSKAAFGGFDEKQLESILYLNSRRMFSLPKISPAEEREKTIWNIPDCESDNFAFAGKGKYFDHDISVAMLASDAEKNNISAVYPASLEALTSSDSITANLKFLHDCEGYSIIHPLAAVDLRNMPEAMRQLDMLCGFAGVIISPYLHNYKLEYPAYSAFFDAVSLRGVKLWINTALGDDRFRDENLHSRRVSCDEIITFASTAPRGSYIFQGCSELVKLSNELPEYCSVECSKLSDFEYVPDELFRTGKPERLCFGSEYPFRDYAEVSSVLGGRKFFS